jgi:hypothetical protein
VYLALGDEEPAAYEGIFGAIAATPLGDDIEGAAGENAATGYEAILEGTIGVDCAELESYAYGVVDVDPGAGIVTLIAKDAEGEELCRQEVEAAEEDFF